MLVEGILRKVILAKFIIAFLFLHFFTLQAGALSFESEGVKFEVADGIEVHQVTKKGKFRVLNESTGGSEPIFAWTPKGYNENYTEQYCSSENLRAIIRSKASKPRSQANLLQRWFNYCNVQVGKGNRSGWGPLISAATLHYEMEDNPQIKSVAIELPSGNIIRGFLALKPGSKPRPIVIAKCGIFCSAEKSRSHFWYFMHFFDESPFHVMTLANVTSTQFEFENSAVALGGFHGGRQFYEVAQAIRSSESPLSRKISSVHVVGSSLGGHSALYSALYGSLNEGIRGNQVIDSVMAICPVVHLRNSMERMFSDGTIADLFTNWAKGKIKRVIHRIPIMGPIFNETTRKNSEILDQISRGAASYYSHWFDYEPWSYAPFKGLRRDLTVDNFYQINNFLRFYDQVRIPTLIVTATNDRIVQYQDNVRLLRDRQKIKDNRFINSVAMGQGDHCAFSESSGWRNLSVLLREYILGQSPEFNRNYSLKKVRIKEEFKNLGWLNRYKLHREELVMGYRFRAYVNDDYMRVRIKIYNPYASTHRDSTGDECWRSKPYLADKNACYRQITAKVKLDKFGIRTPRTKFESNLITRYANTNFDVLNSEGKNIKYTKGFPKKVVFRSY